MKFATPIQARVRKARRNMKRRRVSRERITEGLMDHYPEPAPIRSWRQKERDEADRQDAFDYEYEYLQPMLEDDEYWENYWREMEMEACG